MRSQSISPTSTIEQAHAGTRHSCFDSRHRARRCYFCSQRSPNDTPERYDGESLTDGSTWFVRKHECTTINEKNVVTLSVLATSTKHGPNRSDKCRLTCKSFCKIDRVVTPVILFITVRSNGSPKISGYLPIVFDKPYTCSYPLTYRVNRRLFRSNVRCV